LETGALPIELRTFIRTPRRIRREIRGIFEAARATLDMLKRGD
jgi:hypothetical protein